MLHYSQFFTLQLAYLREIGQFCLQDKTHDNKRQLAFIWRIQILLHPFFTLNFYISSVRKKMALSECNKMSEFQMVYLCLFYSASPFK